MLFPDKLAATVFNNKTDLFEKAKSLFKWWRRQNAAGGLGFCNFLGYEIPPETLKWEHFTVNKSSSEG